MRSVSNQFFALPTPIEMDELEDLLIEFGILESEENAAKLTNAAIAEADEVSRVGKRPSELSCIYT